MICETNAGVFVGENHLEEIYAKYFINHLCSFKPAPNQTLMLIWDSNPESWELPSLDLFFNAKKARKQKGCRQMHDIIRNYAFEQQYGAGNGIIAFV